jgi:hypothetical protein
MFFEEYKFILFCLSFVLRFNSESMKHPLFILLAGLIFPSTFSPPAYSQEFDIGARIGVNMSYFYQNPSGPPLTSPAGIAAGIQMGSWFNYAWALCTQVLFVQKKSGVSGNDGTSNYVGTSSSNYIEIPLETKFRFTKLDNMIIQPYVFAGATVGLLFSAKSVITEDKGQTFTYDDKKRTIDVGAIGGAGFDYRIGSNTIIFAEGNYRFGLVSTTDAYYGLYRVNDLRICTGILFAIQ